MAQFVTSTIKQTLTMVLDRFLKPYVENFNSEHISGGIASGQIELKNLKIKKGALDNLRLPVDVTEGHLGTLTMIVPYFSLGSKPVIIKVENVYLLVEPSANRNDDPAEDEARAHAAKLERLANAEVLATRGQAVADEANVSPGMFQATVNKIVNNVQIEVKNIHIRYEDRISCPGHPFAAGITLERFKAETTDANWQSAFLQSSVATIHKLASLESLAVYFNTDEESIAGLAQEEAISLFQSLVSGKDRSPKHQYILKPVSGEGRIMINHKVDAETPQFDCSVLFQELGFSLDNDQYRDVLSMLDMYHFYVRQAHYRRFRPPEEELQANRPRALLGFAVDTIRKEIHEKQRRWTWAYIQERRNDRLEYMRLYEAKQSSRPALTPDELRKFDELEKKLSYEDLRYFRSLARSEMSKKRAEQLEEQKKLQAQNTSQGWFGWAWSGGQQKGAADQQVATAEQLSKELGLDPSAENLGNLPDDAIKLRITASLNQGSFSLRKKIPTSPEGEEVISVVFDSSRAEVVRRVVPIEATLTLGAFSVFDGTTPGTLHHQIVRVKESAGSQDNMSGTLVPQIIPSDGWNVSQSERANDPLLYLNFVQSPLDHEADSCLTVRMKAMEIIYHREYVEAILAFFKPPESQMESVGALINAASETLGELRAQSRAGLEYALSQHKTVDIKLDMKSPIIIIPEDVTSKTGHHMVLDAGHISVQSDLVPKSELLNVQSKKKRMFTDEDFVHLESMMYDKFFLKLQDAQFVLGTDLDSCMAALDPAGGARELHLLERINMEFSVQNSIVPDAVNLAKLKVSGRLPSLVVNFSNAKYKGLMKMIDIAVPRTGDASPVQAQTLAPGLPGRPEPFKITSGFGRADDDLVIGGHEKHVEQSDDDEDEKDEFVDAETGAGDVNQSGLHQHIFELAFQVEKVQALLFKSVAEGPERLLADLVLEGFALDFALEKFDMLVDIGLKSVSLQMIEGPNRRIPLILPSQPSNLSDAADLVKVHYVRVQPQSPEYMSVYEGVDQSINVNLSTFVIHASPEPIITLYDFIMTTFVPDRGTSGAVTPATPENSSLPSDSPTPPPPTDSGKIKVHVNLRSIELALLDEEIQLATLSLTAAEVTVFIRGATLRVAAKLGNLSVTDDSSLRVINPVFKKIIAIEGEELADFTYESFDPNDKATFPGVNSLVRLRTAALKITFLEQPLHDVYRYLIKFAKMKALYDAATQAAAQRAAEITRMKFDILVKSPIVIFPRDSSSSLDVLVVKLGEIFANNTFSGSVQTISAGLRGIRLTSHFYYNDELAHLKIIEDVEINSTVVQTSDIDRTVDLQRPDTAVEVAMSDVRVSLTQAQYILLMQTLQAIPRVLASDIQTDVQSTPSTAPATPRLDHQKEATPEPAVDLIPELSSTAHAASGQEIRRWSTVDVVFTVKSLKLQLFDKNATMDATLKDSGIVRFALNDNTMRFKMLCDGSTQTEVILKSFTINNTRAGNSRFREMIPAAQHDRNQFMVLFTTVGGTEPSSSVVVSIDSPKVIFAVDPVFALLEMLQSPFTGGEKSPQQSQTAPTDPEAPPPSSSSMSLRVDLHDVSVSILEKDDDVNTQAIQLSIKEILMSQQGVLALTINRMGMSLISMSNPAEKVSFLDEIDIALTFDSRDNAGRQMTSIEINVQPVVLRASLRDINLIMAIVNRGIELSSAQSRPTPEPKPPVNPTSGRRSLGASQAARSSKRSGTLDNRRRSSGRGRVIMTKEKLKATLEGFRLILIGDIHEFPLLHLHTKALTFNANDWSGELQANTTCSTSITYWNLTNSHWEPLIDPWTFSVSVHKDVLSGALTSTLASKERLDVNLTTTFAELALTTINIWSKESERVMKKGRGGDAPYQIVNRTGIPLTITSEPESRRRSLEQLPSARLGDGEKTDWRFDDWRTMRERVSSNRAHSIEVQFEGKPWDAVHNIPVDREGDFVYALRPKTQSVADRLLCEVRVKDNVKVVTLQSTYTLVNQTLYPIEVILVDNNGKPTHPLQKLAPGDDYSIPIEAILGNDIQVHPDPGFGFGWADRPIRWQDLVRTPARTIACPYKDNNRESPFHFQAWASFDANDPINRTYPKMTLHLRAPIELENLLPNDFRFTIYDRDTHKKWKSYLRRGGSTPIHCVHLDLFVLLNIEIQDSVYKPSEFSIINTDDSPDFSIESVLRAADAQDRKLDLGLNYVKHEDAGGAFKVQVYSPFVAINKTGFPFNIRSGSGRVTAGQVGNATMSEPTPYMFSHPREQGAEFTFRLGESSWSKVLNFEAPAAETAVTLSTTGAAKQTHIGVSWASGLGKYKLTKVVTFTPRFIVKNELARELMFREFCDPSNDSLLGPGKSTPVFAFAPGRDVAMVLKYPGLNVNWSEPIVVQNIGVVHVRMKTDKKDVQDLVRVEVSMGGPTIWITVKLESGPWPFKIVNASDYTVVMSQYLSGDDQQRIRNIPSYPITAHTEQPYAWDYPAILDKKLRLQIGQSLRVIDFMEIGDLVPFKFRSENASAVVSLDVRAEGPTQVLTISNYSEETSLYRRRPRSNTIDSTVSRQDTISSSTEAFEAVTEEITLSMAVNIDLEGLGISLINKRLVEVVYLTLSKLKLEYTDSEVAQTVNVACGWIQIDNQLHEAIYPIVLQPMALPRDVNSADALPAIQASVIVLKDQSHGVLFVKYASALLQALSVQMDEDFLFALLDLTKMQGVSWEPEEVDAFCQYLVEIPPPTTIQEGQEMYFEVLELQPMRLSLSFMRTERVNADEKLTLRNPLAVILNAFTMTIGNINDAPLKLNALAIKDMRLTVPVLQERIIYHYRQEVLRQVYRILGSADFIGNPVGLFTNVSSGVADIFYEPYKGVVMHGSKELGIGIAKGAASFAKKTVFGVTDSMTKVASSIGKGLSAATFDSEYQRQRRLTQRKNRPGNAIYGISAGAEALATSFSSGLEGVVMKPLEGAEREGAVGFFKGVGKGLMGAITKPAVGVFDLASNVTEGIRNTTTVFDNTQRNRVRIPRYTPSDGILRVYSQREAVGQAWLKDLDNGTYRSESYVAHIQLPDSDFVVLLTTTRVLAFWSTKLRLKWDLPYTHIERVSVSDGGIFFADKAGSQYGQDVPIPDSSSRQWFFHEVEKVIKQWNANRRVERA